MTATHFIEPLDVLFLRGNKLFGDSGSYGESMIPPWPSVAAGALRSALLSRDGINFERFRKGKTRHPDIGTPTEPGHFRITEFSLARKRDGRLERIYPIPADLVVSDMEENGMLVTRIQPQETHPQIRHSFPLDKLPVLPQQERSKPVSGQWMKQSGWEKYLFGETPMIDDLITTAELWQPDERVGVGLDPVKRCAEDGKLFSVQGAAFCKDVGFAVGVVGADLPEQIMLRFGGDGRGALLHAVESPNPVINRSKLTEAGRCRIVLTTPGLFEDGWRLPGMDEAGNFDLFGVRGRVVAAAVGRAEVISGWDLARWQPKPAQRAAPAGSVYWIENLEATPEALGKLAGHGLWPETAYDSQRRVEGFNRFDLAIY